jgi:hypothetical protein
METVHKGTEALGGLLSNVPLLRLLLMALPADVNHFLWQRRALARCSSQFQGRSGHCWLLLLCSQKKTPKGRSSL